MLQDNLNLLRDEVDRREVDFSKAKLNFTQKLVDTERRHKGLEDLTKKLNEEYFAQRRHHENLIKKLQEEKQLLKLKGVSLNAQYESALKNKTLENQVTKDLAEKRANEYASQFKAKSVKKEETLEIVREQYKKVKLIYTEKLDSLEEAIGYMDQATLKMKRSKQRAIEKEKAVNRQARQLLKRLELEVTSRSQGLDYDPKYEPNDEDDDLEDDTINLDDLDQLKYKMKSIDKKLVDI
jgi:hypothetical protein